MFTKYNEANRFYDQYLFMVTRPINCYTDTINCKSLKYCEIFERNAAEWGKISSHIHISIVSSKNERTHAIGKSTKLDCKWKVGADYFIAGFDFLLSLVQKK